MVMARPVILVAVPWGSVTDAVLSPGKLTARPNLPVTRVAPLVTVPCTTLRMSWVREPEASSKRTVCFCRLHYHRAMGFYAVVDRILQFLIGRVVRMALLQLLFAQWMDEVREWVPDKVRRWTGSLRRLARRIFRENPPVPPPVLRRKRRPWNRTPEHVEEQVFRLHVEQPSLGAGGLGRLAGRVFAFNASRETVRKILLRRRKLVVELEQQRRRRPRRIKVDSSRLLWGLDLTLVWLLGFFPVWILGVVDYQGSRLLGLRRVAWPTSAGVIRALDEIFQQHGKPVRLLTDNAPILCSAAFEGFLVGQGVGHSRIRPGHPWTNGRIERLFRTFKETVLDRKSVV
jgi:transposase InsO family protein